MAVIFYYIRYTKLTNYMKEYAIISLLLLNSFIIIAQNRTVLQ